MTKKNKLLYNPDRVTPPGGSLLDLLDERGMTQVDLAERMGRPIKTINEIINGKAAITSDTALELERVVGVPADFWMRREARYRAYLSRLKECEQLESQKDWLKQFPVKEMVKRGWIKDIGNTLTEQIITLLNYFSVASPEQWKQGWTKRKLAFRKSMNVKTDIGPISVWLRQGELEGEKIECQPFNKEKLISSIPAIRKLTNQTDLEKFMPELINICAASGLAIVFVKPFAKVPVYGAASWLNPKKALVQLSMRGKTADTLWFTIFHELGHIIKHSKKEFFVEIDDKTSNKSVEEHEADHFAAETLIPSTSLNKWLHLNEKLTVASISNFAHELGIHPGILVGRLQHIKKIPHTMFNNLKASYLRN